MPRNMANCPSAVPGAVTETALTPDGIDVIVTASDPSAARTIAGLAELHARFPRPLSPFPHSGLRSGGGRIGYCPILHDDGTEISTTVVPGGVRIHLSARSPERVRELQRIIHSRAVRMRAFASS